MGLKTKPKRVTVGLRPNRQRRTLVVEYPSAPKSPPHCKFRASSSFFVSTNCNLHRRSSKMAQRTNNINIWYLFVMLNFNLLLPFSSGKLHHFSICFSSSIPYLRLLCSIVSIRVLCSCQIHYKIIPNCVELEYIWR